ncbi:hypothetical protein EPR50_G00163040 [Perca flavescens]|uniref:Uncharacterized protein n=1 Tax=Perca flavescens TaxID=8167 RepID=A0A484CNF4_PERFV|nr:hypothetical protein EPR50_G00163040 [Perca flavescens]
MCRITGNQILSTFGTALKMDSTKKGPTGTQTLFQPWGDSGMVVRLDIFRWIHRFDAAIRTLQVRCVQRPLMRWGRAGSDTGSASRIHQARSRTGWRVPQTSTMWTCPSTNVHKTLPHMIPGAWVPCLEAEDGTDRPPQHPPSAAIRRDCGAPADVPSNELLGLEYLFGQSTGESGPFSLKDIVNDGPGPEEEVVQPGQPDPESDEAYQSDVEARDDALDVIVPHITLTSDETSTVHPPAFCE